MTKTITRSFCKFFAALTAMLMTTPAFATLGQPVPGGIDLQEAASPMKEQMHWFHDSLLMPIISAIVLFVFVLLLIVIIRFNAKANPVPSKTSHNVMLEVIWTLVPVLILILVAIPSMKLLYFVDRTHDAEMTVKVTGYQWYWGYEYPDNKIENFMSNMIADKDIKAGQVRLLETDAPLVLPVDTNVRILTTASDVIHSWAVPALGVKLDAIPGRLNETWVRIEKEGTFYGQCSQLCGQNHAFMPIQIRAVSKAAFAEWVKKQGGVMPAPADAAKAKADAAPAAAEKTAVKKTGDKK